MIRALEGHRMSDHHRQMIRYSLPHMKFLEEQIAEMDSRHHREDSPGGSGRGRAD